MSAVLFESNIYSSFNSQEALVTAPIISLNLFENGEPSKVQGLNEPVILKLPHSPNNNYISRIITDTFVNRNLTVQEIVSKGYVECVFFDTQSK